MVPTVVNSPPQPAFRHHDGGDTTYTLYAGGWVRLHSYDGSSLGIALAVTP